MKKPSFDKLLASVGSDVKKLIKKKEEELKKKLLNKKINFKGFAALGPVPITDVEIKYDIQEDEYYILVGTGGIGINAAWYYFDSIDIIYLG
jgi:hypothetical protein